MTPVQFRKLSPVRLLLREEIDGVVAHLALTRDWYWRMTTRFYGRSPPPVTNYSSTFGTARSASSVSSQSGAGLAPAMPATNTVGTCFCFVLYCIAVSL